MMRVTTLVPDIDYAVQQSQQNLATSLEQLSTGLKVNKPSDDPAAEANYVTSLAESANVDQYTANVTTVSSQVQSADSAISSVSTALNSAITLATEGATGTNSDANRQAMATQAEGILQDVVSDANSSYLGNYLFAGSATNTQPFVQASTSYTSQNGSSSVPLTTASVLETDSVTTISDAATGQTFTYKAAAGDTVGDLESAISSAVSAGTLSSGTTAAINANGELAIGSSYGVVVSSDDSTLGAMNAATGSQLANTYAYVGNNVVNSVQVGDSASVLTNVPGNQLFSSAINSLTALVTALQGGSSTQVASVVSGLSAALSTLSNNRVPLDNTISQLSSQDSYLNQETLNLTTQQTSLVGADISTAATDLSQDELQNNAIMAAAAKVLPETLFNYLTNG
jgi:flagellar hook-associated protein 3